MRGEDSSWSRKAVWGGLLLPQGSSGFLLLTLPRLDEAHPQGGGASALLKSNNLC